MKPKRDLIIKVLGNLAVGKNHLGKAVFAGKAFKCGDVVMKFSGPILSKNDVPKKYKGENDRYMQIDIDTYLGPSGDFDDLINHSCDPNTGLKFMDFGILLVAIKNIKKGDEITWDYSTTLFDNQWKMKCDCRSKKCRKIVDDFTLLDNHIQKKYKKIGIIPPYISKYMESEEYKLWSRRHKKC